MMRSRCVLLLVLCSLAWLALFALALRSGLVGREEAPVVLPPEAFEEAGPGGPADTEGARVLATRPRTFNFPNLTVGSLATVLAQEPFGLTLAGHEEWAGLELHGLSYGGQPLGAILSEILLGRGFAFYRQDKRLELVACDAATSQSASGRGQVTSRTLTMELVPGQVAEWWPLASPALRLFLTVQPLHGEDVEEGALPPLALEIEALRGERGWFTRQMTLPPGGPARLESRAQDHMTLEIRPRIVEESSVSLEVRFVYESDRIGE